MCRDKTIGRKRKKKKKEVKNGKKLAKNWQKNGKKIKKRHVEKLYKNYNSRFRAGGIIPIIAKARSTTESKYMRMETRDVAGDLTSV